MYGNKVSQRENVLRPSAKNSRLGSEECEIFCPFSQLFVARLVETALR